LHYFHEKKRENIQALDHLASGGWGFSLQTQNFLGLYQKRTPEKIASLGFFSVDALAPGLYFYSRSNSVLSAKQVDLFFQPD